jgi:MFS family permease
VGLALTKEHIVAPPGFNRWRVAAASVSIHLCIGSVYAWSVFNPPLTRVLGVVAPAADDWTLGSVVWIFSVAIVFLGLSAALAGKWLERVGPRLVGLVSTICWCSGFLIGAAGIHLHQLWLLYLGYGVIGGIGLGLGYVSPVSTLIRWFPDHRGMSTGLAIMGFGGGAILGAPLKTWLLNHFFHAPDYLGTVETLRVVTEQGRQFVETASGRVEVVVATVAQAAVLPGGGAAGAYVVGTGSTGAAATFLVLAAVYLVVMSIAAFSYRVPAAGWLPAGWTPPPESASHGMISAHHVHADEAIRTSQFWLLWVVLCCNVTAGIGVLGVAKTMMGEIFGSALPALVTAAFASTYVLMISVFNMAGRFAWASASDSLGRKNTYTCFFVLGTLLYLSLPWFASMAGGAGTVWQLWGFYAATLLIFTMYGGGFATIPAYLADLFGTMHVGAIHGRLLTAWSVAGVLGPLAITQLRERSVLAAVRELVPQIDPAAFNASFGEPVSQLDELVRANTVSIEKLMLLVPPGTPDPSAGIYNSTMYAMAALLIVALVANWRIHPVASFHYVENARQKG